MNAEPSKPSAAGAAIEVRPVDDKKGLKDFIRLPWTLFRDDPNWIPPLISELKNQLTPGKNPFFEHAEVRYFVAYRSGKPVGRISAQIDKLSLERHGATTGHWGFIDAIDDPAVFAALFKAAEAWLKSKGMDRMIGPFNLTINEESGLLIDGFDTPPMLLMTHALPYYQDRVEALGFKKVMDLYAYVLDIRNEFPATVQRLLRKTEKQKAFEIRPIDMKNYDRDLRNILGIFNEAWEDNWGAIPATPAEVDHTVKSLKMLIREKMAYIAFVGDEPVGFMVALPNLNEAIRDMNGRLTPWNIIKLLWRLKVKVPKTCRVPLMGVRKRYHGTATGAMIAFSLIETIRRNTVALGTDFAELSWILEDNTAMREMLVAIKCRIYKTYRMYEKAIG